MVGRVPPFVHPRPGREREWKARKVKRNEKVQTDLLDSFHSFLHKKKKGSNVLSFFLCETKQGEITV
jgi:hypothetical protein